MLVYWVWCLFRSCIAGTFPSRRSGFSPVLSLNNLVKGQIDRWVFTEDHVAMLEASFLKNPYVSSTDKTLFAQTIGCGEDKVYNLYVASVCAFLLFLRGDEGIAYI
jgi:hypothetical protein